MEKKLATVFERKHSLKIYKIGLQENGFWLKGNNQLIV